MFTNFVILFALLTNLFFVFNSGCSSNRFSSSQTELPKTKKTMDAEFDRLRRRMVDVQLRGRDIRNARVLEAMEKVPRHEFVPADLREFAYNDGALPLKMSQTISQPYIVAYMTQLLELEGTERVLEIGTGSGYQAAVLAEIVPEVYTIEILAELGEQAATVLKRLGYKNIHFLIGDGYAGWPEHAPFDRIIVTAAPRKIPQPLIDQLKEGGLLVCPVGRPDQDLIVLKKGKDGITRRSTIPVRFVTMTGKAEEE
jgi:protein-L-isoaspartate(D-aspartate) O-methyltransferase